MYDIWDRASDGLIPVSCPISASVGGPVFFLWCVWCGSMDRVFRIDLYPQEWLVLTAHMRPAQRGVFIQICCLIYAHRGPIENDADHIGRASNCSSRLARAIIAELLATGDLRMRDGKISQTRCELELNKKRNHLESSSKGGRNKAEKDREVKENNDIESSDINMSPPSSSPSPSPSIREIDRGGVNFNEFYQTYPRHVGRANAQKSYNKARLGGATHEAIITGARRYADECKDKEQRFIAHPASWLNAGRWDDAPGANRDQVNGAKPSGQAGGNRPAPQSRGSIVAELIGQVQGGEPLR